MKTIEKSTVKPEFVVETFFRGRSGDLITNATAILMSRAEDNKKIRQLLGMGESLSSDDLICGLPDEKGWEDSIAAVVAALVFSFSDSLDFILLALQSQFDNHLDNYLDGPLTYVPFIFANGAVVGMFRAVTHPDFQQGRPFRHDNLLLCSVFHLLWHKQSEGEDVGIPSRLAGELSNMLTLFIKDARKNTFRYHALGDRLVGVGNELGDKKGEFPCLAASQVFTDLYFKLESEVSLWERMQFVGGEVFRLRNEK